MKRLARFLPVYFTKKLDFIQLELQFIWPAWLFWANVCRGLLLVLNKIDHMCEKLHVALAFVI